MFTLQDSAFRKYMGWLINTGAGFDRNWNKLRMKLSAVSKHFGLSRSGVQFFSGMGYLSPLTGVDVHEKGVVEMSKTNVE